MPITSQPSRNARMVTARMAGFKPGTSPPPVRIPITPFFVFHVSTLCVARCQIVPAQIPSVLTRSTLWGILRKMVNFEQTKHTLAVYFVDQARFLPDGCFNPHASPGRGHGTGSVRSFSAVHGIFCSRVPFLASVKGDSDTRLGGLKR